MILRFNLTVYLYFVLTLCFFDAYSEAVFMMETNKHRESTEQECPETPSLIRYISSNEVSGFDNAYKPSRLSVQYPPPKVSLI